MGISEKQLNEIRIRSERARESMIKFGVSLKPCADAVVKACNEFKKIKPIQTEEE